MEFAGRSQFPLSLPFSFLQDLVFLICSGGCITRQKSALLMSMSKSGWWAVQWFHPLGTVLCGHRLSHITYFVQPPIDVGHSSHRSVRQNPLKIKRKMSEEWLSLCWLPGLLLEIYTQMSDVEEPLVRPHPSCYGQSLGWSRHPLLICSSYAAGSAISFSFPSFLVLNSGLPFACVLTVTSESWLFHSETVSSTTFLKPWHVALWESNSISLKAGYSVSVLEVSYYLYNEQRILWQRKYDWKSHLKKRCHLALE